MPSSFKPLPVEQYITNSGYLKLDLMLRGIRVDPSLFREGKILERYRLSEKFFGNLDLILPDGTFVSAPYQEAEVESSPYKLRLIRGKYYLTASKESLPVQVIPHPDFYGKKINSHVAIGDVLSCHGGYVSLALGGHRFLQPDLRDFHQEQLQLSMGEVIAILERVRKERALEVVALSAWSTKGEDGGIRQIEPTIRAIKNAFNVRLLVELHIPQKTDWIDLAHTTGIEAVCYHIDSGEHDGLFVDSNGVKASLRMLEHAASIFPRGAVLSHVAVGSRVFEGVREDIYNLARIGVLPILTEESREIILEKGFTTQQLAPLFGHVYDAAKRYRMPMGLFPNLSPFISPSECRNFSAHSSRLKKALMNLNPIRLFGGGVSTKFSLWKSKS